MKTKISRFTTNLSVSHIWHVRRPPGPTYQGHLTDKNGISAMIKWESPQNGSKRVIFGNLMKY